MVHLAIHNSEKEEGGTSGRTDGAREQGDVGAGVWKVGV